MRLVLDTNVVISALIWGGTPYKLLQAATDGDIELLTSPVLMAELRGVLAREHLASRLAQQRTSVEQAVALYGELAISVSPLVTPRAVPRDKDDDHVIAAALAGKANVIVSGDGDLLSLGSFEGMAIVTVAEAVPAPCAGWSLTLPRDGHIEPTGLCRQPTGMKVATRPSASAAARPVSCVNETEVAHVQCPAFHFSSQHDHCERRRASNRLIRNERGSSVIP